MIFLTIGGLAGLIRWSVLGMTTDIAGLIAVQGFHAFTFGATHLAALYYIAKAVPAGFAATAQSLYSSFAVGTTMAFAMLASGWLYELYAGAAFFAMAGMSIAGILLLIPIRFIAEKLA